MIGVPGVEIAWNQVINQPGQSAVEDNINFYLSKGTSFSPIHAHNNYIDGAFPNITASTTSYPRYSGSGIVCADGNPASASEVTAYIRCANNQVLDSLNVGIATPHGHHIELANNRVVVTMTVCNCSLGLPSACIARTSQVTHPRRTSTAIRYTTTLWRQ